MTETADLILHNARIPARNGGPSTAGLVAIKEDRILRTGHADDLGMLRGAHTRVVDCGGAAILPGFIDAHVHLFAWAANLLGVDCSPRAAASVADVLRSVRRRAQETPAGTWIRGWGLEEFHLAEGRLPHRQELDEAAPEHPVKLVHRSGHASVLNSAALRLLGISESTPEPPGAVMERDASTGDLTGYLLEMEHGIEARGAPALSAAEIRQGLDLAMRRLLSLGITSIHEATPSRAIEQWDLLHGLRKDGNLPVRVYKMFAPADLGELRRRRMPYLAGDDWLRAGSIKIMLNETGARVLPSPDDLRRQVLDAHEAGFQVAFHAAAQAGVEAALDAVEATPLAPSPRVPELERVGVRSGLRHRIEHCGICPPALARRIAAAGMLVSSQPGFIREHGERYRAQVARDQQRWLYPFATLAGAGVPLAFGSDCPVTPPDPLAGVFAAVTRLPRRGPALHPEEGLPLAAALDAYTLGAAHASFDEGRKGKIAPGCLADLVVLSADPLDTAPERREDIRVLKTIVGGRVVWEG